MRSLKKAFCLQWIPRHSDISGNADRLAKAGSLMSRPDSPLSLRNIKRIIYSKWKMNRASLYSDAAVATRKTTRRQDRRIVQQALVDPTVTRSTIGADVGVAIVAQTISRHLAEVNLKSTHKRLFRALPLTPENRQLRLQWCQARSMWNVTDWQKVVLSDESRFVLGTDDNR
ncbi:transposable element Tc1 transposase [Trichonephila clavipes]|nr:transposable element Tc1 transposase [Trichonephila clavipes]